MKKLLFVPLFMVFVFSVFSQDILYRNTATVEWDTPVVTLLSGESLEYNVYLWDMAGGDPTTQPPSALIYIGRATGTQLAIDMTSLPRKDYAVAVQSVLKQADATEVEGEIAYSTVAVDVDPTMGGAFLYVPQFGIISKPTNLKDMGM